MLHFPSLCLCPCPKLLLCLDMKHSQLNRKLKFCKKTCFALVTHDSVSSAIQVVDPQAANIKQAENFIKVLLSHIQKLGISTTTKVSALKSKKHAAKKLQHILWGIGRWIENWLEQYHQWEFIIIWYIDKNLHWSGKQISKQGRSRLQGIQGLIDEKDVIQQNCKQYKKRRLLKQKDERKIDIK